MPTENKTRSYRKRARAEHEERTRQRITEAAVKLHGSVGPARTTISGIAEEAGVQRATVYRHFPDEEAIFQACTAHWASLNPPPDHTAWADIRDPSERLRAALTELYDWYGWAEPMLSRTTRDAPVVPAMQPTVALIAQLGAARRDVVLKGRPERGSARQRVAAAIAHAISFPAYRSLVVEQGLPEAEAVALMTAMVESAGRARSR